MWRRDFERFQRIAQEWEKIRPSPEQMETLQRQSEAMRELLGDPAVRQAHMDTSRIMAERTRLLSQMPDVQTQKALLEAAQYFDSDAFRVQREALLETHEAVQQRLGPLGLAAAQRVATRGAAADRGYERAAERIRIGQATELLEAATQLAVSREVRETIERANPQS